MQKINTTVLRWFLKRQPIFIFMGQSGAGKNTVATELIKFFWKLSPRRGVQYIETGALFREETQKMTPSIRKRLQDVNDAGDIQAPVFPTMLWSREYVYYNENNQPVILDGSPRSVHEAEAVIDMFKPGELHDIIVIVFDVTDQTSETRMILRNQKLLAESKPLRSDSATPEARKRKLGFYHSHVVPAISILQKAGCAMYHVNAEQDDPKKVYEETLECIVDYAIKKNNNQVLP